MGPGFESQRDHKSGFKAAFFVLGWDPVSAVSGSRSGINLPIADNTLIFDNSCGTTELVFQKNLDIESILTPFKFDEIRKSK